MAEMKPKKKKSPVGLSGIQKDSLQSVRDRKLTDTKAALEDGKIDHGDSAQKGKGILDPEEFEKFAVEVGDRTVTEVQRISKVILEHLNEHYSRGGKFEWTLGFFTPTDPNSNGSNGWQALTPEMIGEAWSAQLQRELGLTIFNGALCWNGMGTFERHIICAKTKQLEQRQIAAREAGMEQQLRQPEQVAGEKVGKLEVKETQKKMPLYPMQDPGDGITDGGTVNTE